MRVLFDHHSPFLLAHGGFQIQIEQTFKALGEIGVDVDWLRFWDSSHNASLIHYFGPCPRWYAEFAHNNNIKVIVTDLHTGLGSRSLRRRTIQGKIIAFSRKFLKPLSNRMDWGRFNLPDAIVALTQFEADLMCNIFHAPKEKMHVIPNGVDNVFLEKSSIPREDWLLCTAVIHPRKRVLELAKAALIAKTPLRIYGRPYSEKDSYFHAFRDVVEKSNGLVRWEGSLSDRTALADVYRRARGFVLPSTMESLSLSALEAAATGCPLLLSELPWATTTFGPHASYSPNSPQPTVLAASLAAFHHTPKCPGGFRVLSWVDVAQELQKLYTAILTR